MYFCHAIRMLSLFMKPAGVSPHTWAKWGIYDVLVIHWIVLAKYIFFTLKMQSTFYYKFLRLNIFLCWNAFFSYLKHLISRNNKWLLFYLIKSDQNKAEWHHALETH